MKTLSDDTRRIAVASHIRPVPLVVVSYRADEGVRKLYLSGRDYWHGGHLYLGLIAQGGLSDISYSLKGIGGIATLSSATLRLVNATDNPNLPLSAMLKDYTLINQDVTIDYLFEPATETIRIFSGKIQDVSVTRQGISLTIQNAPFEIQSIPAHLASLGEHPNIPLSNAGRPVPVVFGNLNTSHADDRNAQDVLLAPCMNLDFLAREYTAGERAKTRGFVYSFDEEEENFTRERITQLQGQIVTFNLPQATKKKIFQAIEGYKDSAANYADGDVVNAANRVLSSPLDIAHALLRDRKIGMGIPTAQVDRSAIVQDRAKMPAGYRFDFSMNEAHDFDAFAELLMHGLLHMSFDADGMCRIKPSNSPDAVVAHFNGWNILRDTFRMKKSPTREIANHFFMRYGWHEALGYYTKSLIRSPKVKWQGIGTLTASGPNPTIGAGLLAGAASEMTAGDISPTRGDRVWIDGKYYICLTADILNDRFYIHLNPEGGTLRSQVTPKNDVQFYLGTNFDYRCFHSSQRYGIGQSYKGHEAQAIETKYIQDESTARAFLDALIQYYSHAEDIAKFKTGIGAVALDPGDVISIDHPLLGPADAARGALNQAISWPDTAFGISHPTAGGLGAEDVIVLEDAGTGAFEMIRITSASGGRVTACERGYGNGIPRRWGSGHAFARIRKKWQIADIGLNLTAAEVTITARSVRA